VAAGSIVGERIKSGGVSGCFTGHMKLEGHHGFLERKEGLAPENSDCRAKQGFLPSQNKLWLLKTPELPPRVAFLWAPHALLPRKNPRLQAKTFDLPPREDSSRPMQA
jgi:hypothetical protein